MRARIVRVLAKWFTGPLVRIGDIVGRRRRPGAASRGKLLLGAYKRVFAIVFYVNEYRWRRLRR